MAAKEESEVGTSSNFQLCIKCQKGPLKDLVHPEKQSYDKFLAAVSKRAEFGNTDFIALNERIRKYSAQDLSDNNVMWHKTCYGNTVSKERIERDEQRHKRACETSDVTVLSDRSKGRPSTSSMVNKTEEVPKKYTRSKKTPFDKKECFFCQCKTIHPLIEGRSENVGKQIKDIVHKCCN